MTTTTMQAIETRYKGYRFRSRTEARWAVYFDALGLEWEYEPEGFELGDGVRYLPDFWLPQVRMWAEVKPTDPHPGERHKARRLVQASGYGLVFLVGVPDKRAYDLVDPMIGEDTDVVVSMFHNYPVDEGRFYVSTGMTADDFRKYWTDPDMDAAIQAARGARFEFGEEGYRR